MYFSYYWYEREAWADAHTWTYKGAIKSAIKIQIYWKLKRDIINHKLAIIKVTDTSPASPYGIIQLQVQGMNLPTTVSAKALASNGTMPSTTHA